MNATTLIEAVGWTLAHFLWQGVLVALLVAGLLRLLRTALARYVAAAGGMVVLLLLSTGTLVLSLSEHDPTMGRNPLPKMTLTHEPVAKAGGLPTDVSGSENETYFRHSPRWPHTEAAADTASATATTNTNLGPTPWQFWVVGFWLCGVTAFVLRLLLDWRATFSLRKSARALPLDSPWSNRLTLLAENTRSSRMVRLLTSTAVGVPVVVGVLRPAVIVPLSMLTNLPPAQVDAILLHELAHIRRHDFLINLLQSLVEALYFYHPAVWWISRRIRIEREHCCDDLAAFHCGSVRDYAGALAALEEARLTRSPALSVAANGGTRGNLFHRIRRLVASEESSHFKLSWPPVMFGLLAIVASLMTFAMITQAGENDDKWKSLLFTRLGDDHREIFCIHTDDQIQAVVVVEMPEELGASSAKAGVRRSRQKLGSRKVWADFRWDVDRLQIEFDSSKPDELRLNDQTLLLQFGRVVFWRQAERWADQSTVLAADLPETKRQNEVRNWIVETFAPADEDKVLAPHRAGTWELGSGISLSIEGKSEASVKAVIRWAASEKWPALRHEIPLAEIPPLGNLPLVGEKPGDELGFPRRLEPRDRWALALEKSSHVLWVSGLDDHQRIDFSDPERIASNFSNTAFTDMPGAVRAELQTHFRLNKRLDKNGIAYIGGNRSGDDLVTARIDEEFVIRGTVLDLRNQPPRPLAGVPIDAFLLADDPVASAVSAENGEWELRFRLSLGDMKNGKWLEVKTNQPDTIDRDVFGAGEFAVSLTSAPVESKPEHVKVLEPGDPIEGVTFRLMKAGKIAGTLCDAEGKPIPDAYVAVKVDNAERNPPDGAMRRDGKFVRGVRTDTEGKFELTSIPPNRKLHLTATKRGKVVQTGAYDFGEKKYIVEVIWSEDDTLTCGLGEETVTEVGPIILRMTKEGKISFRSEEMTPGDFLRNHGLDDSNPDLPCLISAPEDTPYYLVVEAVNLFKRSSNLRNISFISELEAEKRFESHPKEITIIISREGTTIADGEEMGGDALAAHLKNVAERIQKPGLPIIVRAQEETPFEHITAVLEQIRKAGFRNVSFATETKTDVTF